MLLNFFKPVAVVCLVSLNMDCCALVFYYLYYDPLMFYIKQYTAIISKQC